MQESRRNHFLYHERELLKHNKMQTSRVTWGTQVLIEMTNWFIMCLILRCLIRAHCFFLLHLGEHMQKYSGYVDLQFASSCIAPSWGLNLRWLLLPSQFFLFFFPSAASKASVIKAVWAREREGGRGKRKKRMKTPKWTEECANRAVYTNKSNIPQILSFSFLFRAKVLSDRLNISIDAISLSFSFSISDPQARVHNIAALSWPK